MKNYRRKSKLSPSIFMVWFALASLLYMAVSITAKRFDKDKPIDLLSEIDDLGVPIEVTQELIQFEPIHKGQSKPVSKPPVSKPKPEFPLSLFHFPKPESLEYSSSWSLGSAFAPTLGSSFSAHRPPSSSPYMTQEKPETAMASEASILLSPSGMNTGMSHSGSHGKPRPPPSPSQGISADSHLETEALVPKPPSSPGIQSRPPSQQPSSPTILYLDTSNIPPPVFSQAAPSPMSPSSSWNTQPQTQPVVYQPPQQVASQAPPPISAQSVPTWLSQPQPQPQSPPQYQPVQWSQQTAPAPPPPSQTQQNTWTLQPSPPVSSQPSPVYSQQAPPAYQQSPPAYQQAPPVYQQTQVTYVQPPPPVYSQSPPAYSQSSPTYSQPSPPVYSQQSPPSYLASPSQSQPAYQPQNPSAPFSMYQQLNLHLLEHDTWEKVQHQNEDHQPQPPPPPPQQPVQQPPQNNPIFSPPQLFQQPLPQSGASIPQPPMYLMTPNITSINTIPLAIGNILDESKEEVLDMSMNDLGGEQDYKPNPGFSPVPHYTNLDVNVSIDDEKFFYTDDDFAEYPDRRKHQDKNKKGQDKNKDKLTDKENKVEDEKKVEDNSSQDDYNEQTQGEIIKSEVEEKGEPEVESNKEPERQEEIKTPTQSEDESILQGKSDKDDDEIMEMVE